MTVCSCGAPGVYRGLMCAWVCGPCHDRERERVEWARAVPELGHVVGITAPAPRGPLCSCGEAADRMLLASYYCRKCAAEVLGPIRARHGWDGIGRGRAPLFDTAGDVLVACDQCGATWRGPIGEHCSYCVTALMAMQDAQRSVLLRPDLPDPDDERRPAAMRGWVERLARAVTAGLLERHQAEAAIRREEDSHAA